LSDVPITPELEEAGWLVQDTWRDVPYDWSSLMENVLDASHVPFTHHKSISNRNVIGAYDIHLSEPVTRTGFRSMWNTGPRAGALGPQSSWFKPPCFMMQKIDAKENKGYESLVVVYAVPIAPGRCRLLNRNAFRFTKGGGLAAWAMQLIPGWATHLGTQVPLEDDQIFLHLGEEQYVAAAAKGKTAAQAYYMPSAADTNVIAFRRWIDQFGGGGPFGEVGRASYKAKLQPRQEHTQLLDRYSQHTAHCVQCQEGLKQVQTARSIFHVAAGITGILGLLSAAAGLSAAALTAAAAAPGASGNAVAGQLLQLLLPLPQNANAAAAGVVAAAAAGRAMMWLGAAAVCWFVNSKLGGLEKAFYTGSYPPPRNTDKK
jgi:phenylpropionate dioxygenase-like ring-hydroxylating dioxygenase large terminal subunit